MLKVLIETCHGRDTEEIEYTNGAHQFLLHYEVPYRLMGDYIIVFQPKDGIVIQTDAQEVQKDSLLELQSIAAKYGAVISVYGKGLTIEFLPENV